MKYQIRYLIKGLDLEDIPDHEKILLNNDFFLKKDGKEVSCLIISSNEPSYDRQDMAELAERIVYFVDFCSIVKDHGFALVYMATSLIEESKIGEIYSVLKGGILDQIYSSQRIGISKFLIDEINKILPDLKIMYKKCPFIEIAIRSWIDAKENLARYGRYDKIQFLKGITTLESLLGSTDSLRYTITMRLSFVLSFMGFDSLDVFDRFSKLYIKRNNFVHGNIEKNEISNDDIDLIFEYSRKSIIFCCIIWNKYLKNSDISKDKLKAEFVKKIDYSIISNNEKEKLYEIIQFELERFKLLYSG